MGGVCLLKGEGYNRGTPLKIIGTAIELGGGNGEPPSRPANVGGRCETAETFDKGDEVDGWPEVLLFSILKKCGRISRTRHKGSPITRYHEEKNHNCRKCY